MPLTLAVIAGLALLLPGLVGLALWNLRARRSTASRPELPLTAVSALTVAIGVSIFAHLSMYLIVTAGLGLGPALGHAVPPIARLSPLLVHFFYDAGHLRPVWSKPFELAVSIAAGKAATARSLAIVGGLIAAETLIVIAFVTDEGVDLALDGVDLSNQG